MLGSIIPEGPAGFRFVHRTAPGLPARAQLLLQFGATGTQVLRLTDVLREVEDALAGGGVDPLEIADARRAIAAALPEHLGPRRLALAFEHRQHVVAVEHDPGRRRRARS